MSIAQLLIRAAPHVTLRRLVATLVLCWVLVHIVWPVLSIVGAGAFTRNDFDNAVLESGRGGDVTDIVEHFVKPNKRFEHIVERLWELGFETKRLLGTGIYRRRTVPPSRGPDERNRGTTRRYNSMLDEHDAAYMAQLSRTIPAGSLTHKYSVWVYILVRNDQSTVIEASSGRAPRIQVP